MRKSELKSYLEEKYGKGNVKIGAYPGYQGPIVQAKVNNKWLFMGYYDELLQQIDFEKDHQIMDRSNPVPQKLGRIVEIRYERTGGKHPGAYKHVFKPGTGDLFVGRDKNGQKCLIVRKKKGK